MQQGRTGTEDLPQPGLEGERGLGDYVTRQYATARRFWELARERPGFECPYEPESNIVCFRYGAGDQAALRERLMEDGAFLLTSAEIGGVRHLRITVMAPATDDKTLEALLDRIAEGRNRSAVDVLLASKSGSPP
ncbi:hypothetical protein ACFQX6_34710 [Streptosporangium lutulentum]